MKRFAIVCLFALSLSLLAGCRMVVASPGNEEFREAWDEAMDEVQNDLREDLEDGALVREDGDWSALGDFMDRIGRAVDGLEENQDRLEDLGGEGKKHRWQVLDAAGTELYVITGETRVEALDDLLLGDGDGWDGTRDGVDGNPLYTYVYWQEETLRAGQDPDGEREYEELLRFRVYGDEDAMEMSVLPGVSALLPWDDSENGLLSFTLRVSAETAEALRDPARFSE